MKPRSGTTTRLAFYVPHFDPRPVGLGTYVHEVCGRLLDRAGRADLYTETPEHVPRGWRTRAEIHCVPLPRRRWSRAAARQLWLNASFPSELRRRGIDALFVPFHGGTIFPRVHQVVVIHDLTPLVVPSGYFHPLSSIYLRRVLPAVLRRSTVIAVSENTRRDIERLLGVNGTSIRVVGEGYDRTLFRRRSASEIAEARAAHGLPSAYVLYSGTYAAHKNAASLVEILRRCNDRGLDLVLAMTGRPDAGDFAAVRDAARRLGVEDQVRSLGYVERDRLAALMSGATAFVFPSRYEGFGLAPLEAMACGAVVLSSDRASLPEVVGDGGVLLDPDDHEAWAVELARLVHEPEYAEALRSAALLRASRFDWDSVADTLAELLQIT